MKTYIYCLVGVCRMETYTVQLEYDEWRPIYIYILFSWSMQNGDLYILFIWSMKNEDLYTVQLEH